MGEEIMANQSIIEFDNLSFNRKVNWNFEIIEEFSHLLNWVGLSGNPSIQWHENEITKYQNYIDWTEAANNPTFPWTKLLFFKYKDFIDWKRIPNLPVKLGIDDITFLTKDERRQLAWYKNVDWSAWLIERFKEDLDWEQLIYNPSLPYSEYFFTAYDDRLYFIDVVTHPWLMRDENLEILDRIAFVNFDYLSEWKQDWSLDFIEEHKESLNWELLSSNQFLPWSEDLLYKYEDRWNWHSMSGIRNVPWTWELIEKYENEWNWKDDSNPYENLHRTLSTNPSLPWSQKFVDRFWHHMEFGGVKKLAENEYTFQYGISSNEKIDWDLDFLMKYKDLWDIDALEMNETVYNYIKSVVPEKDLLHLVKALPEFEA
jgi:hypothetical protein